MFSPEMKVSITLSKNILTAKLEDAKDKRKTAFILFRDGELVEETRYSDEQEYTVRLSQPGTYYVSVFCDQNGIRHSRNTKTVQYFTEDLQAEYAEFLKRPRYCDSFDLDLPFVPNEYPFYDFVIIGSKTGDTTQAESFFQYALPDAGEWKRTLITNGKLENNRLFSGIMTHNDRFIFGDQDAAYLPSDLAGFTGCFSCLQIEEKEICVFSDFFNFCHLYYYTDQDTVMVSNRYHMLLHYLAPYYTGEGVDVEKAAILLASHNLPTAYHNITFQMDVKGVYQLPAYYNLYLNDKGVALVENEFYREISRGYIYNQQAYEDLLRAGKDDIIREIKTIFDDPRINNVKIDLSGGMDSRTVYAALTHVRENKNKASIHTLDSGKEDLAIATYINGKYGYPNDTIPETHINKSIYTADHLMRSFFIGTNYEHNPSTYTNQMDGVIRLTGAGGDIIIRSFYARQYLNEGFQNVTEAVDYLTNQYMEFVRADYDLAYAGFNDLYKKTLTEIPVESISQKLDLLWLMLGSGYHFFTEFKHNTGELEYSILMSKSLFRAKLMSLDAHKDARMHAEVISLLSSKLARIPYDKDINNMRQDAEKYTPLTRKVLIRGLRFVGRRMGKNISKTLEEQIAQMDIRKAIHKKWLMYKNNRNAWETDTKRKQEALTIVYPDTMQDEINWQHREYSSILYESVLDNLAALFSLCPDLERLCGNAVYYYALTNKENLQCIRILYNKTTSLLDQARIIQGKNESDTGSADFEIKWVYWIYPATKNVSVSIPNSRTLHVCVQRVDDSPSYIQLFDNNFDLSPSEKYHRIAKLTGNMLSFSYVVNASTAGRITVFFMEYNGRSRISNRSETVVLKSSPQSIQHQWFVTERAELFKLAVLFQFDADTAVEIRNILIEQENR